MTSIVAMRAALRREADRSLDLASATETRAVVRAIEALRGAAGSVQHSPGFALQRLARQTTDLVTAGHKTFSALGRDRVTAEIHAAAPEAAQVTRTAKLPPAFLDVPATVDGMVERVAATVTDSDSLLRQADQVERLVITESWRSYNAGRDAAISALSRAGNGATYAVAGFQITRLAAEDFFPAFVKVWDATLDKRTCPTCADLDGSMTLLGMFFDRSAPVHPRCRCQVSFWAVPLPNPAR